MAIIKVIKESNLRNNLSTEGTVYPITSSDAVYIPGKGKLTTVLNKKVGYMYIPKYPDNDGKYHLLGFNSVSDFREWAANFKDMSEWIVIPKYVISDSIVDITNKSSNLDGYYIPINEEGMPTEETFKDFNSRYMISNNVGEFVDDYHIGSNSELLIGNKTTLQGDGNLYLNNTKITAGFNQIFNDNLNIYGLMHNTAVYPEWFGAKGDGITDDSDAIQRAIDNAGHVPVVLTAQSYLVKKTINMIEPFGKENINSAFNYTHTYGSTWNCYQTLIVMHDIIGDAALAGPVIRTASNFNRLEIRGALVVRNASDDAIGVTCVGHQYSSNESSTPDSINTSDLAVSQYIDINAVVKGPDSFPYWSGKDPDATTYGLGKGTAVKYGGGPSNFVRINRIFGFKNGLWLTYSNGGTFNVGTSSCINDILIDGDSAAWSAGITRNNIRLGCHSLTASWPWVKSSTEPICCVKIGDNKHYNNNLVEVANNRIVVDTSNVAADYAYHHIFYKPGNNSMSGNEFITTHTLLGAKLSTLTYEPIKVTPSACGISNINNKYKNYVAWDYKTINMTAGYECEITPVIIDSATHSACYRYGNSNTSTESKFLCEKVIVTSKITPEKESTTTNTGIKILVPYYTQLFKCHLSSDPSILTASNTVKGHIYISRTKDSACTGIDLYQVYGWESGTYKLLGYVTEDIHTKVNMLE